MFVLLEVIWKTHYSLLYCSSILFIIGGLILSLEVKEEGISAVRWMQTLSGLIISVTGESQVFCSTFD